MSEPTSCWRAEGGYCERCDLLLGLPGLRVTGVDRDDGGGPLVVQVESEPAVMGCPACGVVAHGHGRVVVRLVDAPSFGRPVRVVWRKRRWVCPDPGCPVRSFVEQDEGGVIASKQRRVWLVLSGSAGRVGCMAGTRRLVTVADRVEISTGLKAGWSITAIAAHIGRDKSVVSREVGRNSTKTRGYRLVHADCEAQRRRARPQQGKVAASPVLSARVRADLRQGRSPKAIAGRLAAEAADPGLPVASGSPVAHGERVSHEAIYAYIYALPKGELARHGIMLESKRTRRRPRTPLGARKTGPIVGMRSIHDRPAEVADRKVPGHWEGDLIIGRAGKTAAATLVERTTRFTAILGLPLGKDSDGVADALIEHTSVLPALFRKSLTWDQGSEMARHAHLATVTGLDVYFADPHSPWQRPTNENTNRRIRRYLPKGTDITDHQPYLNAIAEELNEMPLRCLGWLTPREAYEHLLTSNVATTA